MITFQVKDMTWEHCAGTIAKAVSRADKSARVEIDIRQKLVRVRSEAPAAELAEAIRDAGYTPQEVEAALDPPRAPRTARGCGCSRKTAPVDPAQAPAGSAASCCS